MRKLLFGVLWKSINKYQQITPIESLWQASNSLLYVVRPSINNSEYLLMYGEQPYTNLLTVLQNKDDKIHIIKAPN